MNMHNDKQYSSGRIRAFLFGAMLAAGVVFAAQHFTGDAQAAPYAGSKDPWPGEDIRVIDDPENGVACYYFKDWRSAISCVQVREGKAPL